MRFLRRPRRGRVLAAGVYLAEQLNLAAEISRELDRSERWVVEQRWLAVGPISPDRALARRTRHRVDHLEPKFELLERLLTDAGVHSYDYLLLVDDDADLPERFVDRFLDIQHQLGFSLAQPARTGDSHIDLPIVERHPGLLARETLFVEQGPVVCFHRSALQLLWPFDKTSPMGWGLENVWSLQLSRAGLRLGIVDAVPVGHRLRAPLANYSWDEADAGRRRLLESTAHRPTEDCFRVLAAHRPRVE